MRNTNNKTPIIVSIIFLLVFNTKAFGQNDIASRYIFNTITIDNGLPINFIDDIFKDSRGFLWVSTQGGGLSRYDGYEFVHFNVNSSPISLKSNFIRKTYEDRFNRLWIISDMGVDVVDLKTLTKCDLPELTGFAQGISECLTSAIYNDSKGNIWIAFDEKLCRINFDEKGKITNLITLSSNTPKSDYAFSVISEIGNEIWIGSKGRVYKANTGLSNISLQLAADPLDFGNNAYISSIIEKEKTVWIGTEYGLYRYNQIDNTLKHYTHNPNNPFSLSQDMVTDLDMTSDGILVVSTLRGLNFYDLFSDNFELISHHNSDSPYLNSDFVNCMLSDGNNLWIGTEAGGINKMTLRSLAINNYKHDSKNPNSLSPNPVNAILEDQTGNLWIGTVEGGLNKKPRGENRFIHYTLQNAGLIHNSVSELALDKEGNLWIGTWGGGISILEINKLPQIVYKSFPPTVGIGYIGLLRYDPINNGMWIGTNRGIFYCDIQSNQIKTPLPTNMTNNIRGVIGGLIDDKNQLWIGTSNGVILINLKTFDRVNFKCPAKYLELDQQSISKQFLQNVTCIYQGNDKAIWIGSNGYGFCKLTANGNSYKSQLYTTMNGLTNNNVLGILEDEQGLIWISTGYGMSCYNPQTDRFANYTQNDGLLDNQFYWNAAYKSPTTKNLYFGGFCGLTELKSSNLNTEEKQMKVALTKLQILNETVWNSNKYIDNSISYATHLNMHERDKSFSIEFSALDYDNPSTIIYSYRLLGFDDEWIDVPASRRFANYTNLQPGKYTFQVRCMSGTSEWSDDITELEINIHPFFYKTHWFIGIMVCLLTFLVLQFYRWRVNSLKKQREALHKKVEERTKELKEQKSLLEEQASELKLQNNILSTQNEKISNQQKQLIEMSDKVKEAMTDRISFFTNITHEFRTPITLIVGPIERALKLSTNPKVVEQLQFVARNSKHLLSLVNQLMDFRKVESENISINPINGNLLSFLDETIIPFESFANERRITIRKLYRLDPPYILFDEEAARKVITNLLSNAIKFTPNGGSITLYVASITDRKTSSEKLYISVSDTGIGIKEEDLKKIFQRFYQSKGDSRFPVYGQSGTGIGLYLCEKIVSLLNGKIEAKSNHTKGTSFRILLPLKREEGYVIPIEEQKTEIYEDIEEDETAAIENHPDNQKMTILVVEDNNDMRDYIRSILIEYYKVLEAANGAEALKILREKPIDFIISDLMMPVMDGLELSQKVKADFSISHIPFLMLTAKTSTEARISSYKMGADEFLQKPFDEELLLTRIHNILETRKTYQRKFSLHMDVNELNVVKESNDEKFLRKAIETVKDNYRNPYYEVSDFTEAMGVSKSLLNKKMQTLTGQSAGHFIRNYRLNLAHEMILKNKGNITISEIAYEVGFNDPKYFTRCFTKHFGIAPSSLFKGGK